MKLYLIKVGYSQEVTSVHPDFFLTCGENEEEIRNFHEQWVKSRSVRSGGYIESIKKISNVMDGSGRVYKLNLEPSTKTHELEGLADKMEL